MVVGGNAVVEDIREKSDLDATGTVSGRTPVHIGSAVRVDKREKFIMDAKAVIGSSVGVAGTAVVADTREILMVGRQS